ncbi:MAG: hypothetical protein J1F20_05360 [Muribaculaceae bacterium]|nr:hypothetical protein [Muribaculaceae bacterium]
MKTRVHINPKYESKYGDFVRRLANEGMPSRAESLYSGRNHIYKIPIGEEAVNVKSFRRPSVFNSLVYTNFRKSKARRSYENALYLIAHDLPTPAPIAWIEKKSGGRLSESYYICEQSPYENNLRIWEKWDEATRDKVLYKYARLMVKIHEAGVWHHDLSPGNILWTDTADDDIKFHIVDLNRMTLLNRPLNTKERFSNFRNINLVSAETARLARHYADAVGMSPDKAEQLAVKTLADDRKRKERLHKIKKIIKMFHVKR